MVTPFSRSLRTISHISRRSSTSTPAVGSSRNSMVGSWLSALAIITRRFMPPDSAMILLSFLSHSDRSRRIFSISAGLRGLPNRPRLKRTVAHTVSKASVSAPAAPGRSWCARRGSRGPRRGRRPGPCPAGIDDAADDADQRGLAGPVGTQQGEDLALLDVQIDPLEGLMAGRIGLCQTRYRYDGSHAVSPNAMRGIARPLQKVAKRASNGVVRSR
jgi:hypothetical protein